MDPDVVQAQPFDTRAAVDAAERSANPYLPAVASDPLPFYDELRATCPVASLSGLPNTHIISRYDDVKFALQHPEIFSSDVAAVDIGQLRPLIPLQIDPPEHAKYRRVIDPHLGIKHLLPIEESVRALVSQQIDTFIDDGHCDAHAQFTVPLPCTVFLQLCGLPVENLDTYLGWKDDIIRPQIRHPEVAYDPDAARQIRHDTGAAIYDFFDDIIRDRRENPGDDVISRFALGEVDGEQMTHEQMLDLGFLFILGGLDTVTSSLDCMLAHLAEDEPMRDTIVADPTMIPQVIEELLRVHTPVMQVLRVIKEPFEMHGVAMEPGDTVMVMVGAADTDSSEFGPDADEARTDRDVNRHLAFGGGPHRCLGSHLARFELRVALEEWHRRIPDYRLVDGAQLDYSPGIREIASLPLTFGAR